MRDTLELAGWCVRRTVVLLAVVSALSVSPRATFGQHRADARSGISLSIEAMPGVPPQPHAPKQRTGGRVVLQFLASSVGAVGGGLGTFLLLRDLGEQRVVGDAGYTRAGNIGYLIGSFGGAALGAHVVGTNMGGKSLWWATSLGSLIGTLPIAALGVDEPYLPLFGLALGWIPQAALATIGFSSGERR